MSQSVQPYLKEFARLAPRPGSPLPPGLLDESRIGGHIVRSEGFRGHWSPYSLFEEMEDKDPHLFSLLQTRKLGLLARPQKVLPTADDQTARQAAVWLERTLGGLAGWHGALMHLLDALGKGMAVLEILWDFDAQGRLRPSRLKPREAGRFIRDDQGNWLLRPDLHQPVSAAQPLPPHKFIIMLTGQTDERPYGKGLCERVYWYWWFKKHNIKFWLIYNEKFGSPTVVARHRSGLSQAERDRLLEVIDALQTEAGVTIPEGVELELLEASRTGSGETYPNLVRWCNDEMSRAVLGQTLTSSQGEGSGSYALARVHEEVRSDYLRSDANLLMDVINTQLIAPMIAMNFGQDVCSPRWTLDLSPQLDLEAEIKVDRQLLQMGVFLPESYFYEKYGRPAPAGDARQLQYDDSNLYQYHLQFGVLTINEVRAKLGLAPVPWGHQPTSPVDPAQTPTHTRRGSTGEDLTSEKESEGGGELEDELKAIKRKEH